MKTTRTHSEIADDLDKLRGEIEKLISRAQELVDEAGGVVQQTAESGWLLYMKVSMSSDYSIPGYYQWLTMADTAEELREKKETFKQHGPKQSS